MCYLYERVCKLMMLANRKTIPIYREVLCDENLYVLVRKLMFTSFFPYFCNHIN